MATDDITAILSSVAYRVAGLRADLNNVRYAFQGGGAFLRMATRTAHEAGIEIQGHYDAMQAVIEDEQQRVSAPDHPRRICLRTRLRRTICKGYKANALQ